MEYADMKEMNQVQITVQRQLGYSDTNISPGTRILTVHKY